jgi:4-hydroxy-4-methyl-2-oxoglutarate aldolase
MKKQSTRVLLAEIREKLYVSMMSDVLDDLGYRNQVLRPNIRPLDDELVMAGYARTGLFRDVYHQVDGGNPYELEIKLLDDLKTGEVAVFACGNSGRIAPWGELCSLAARARGAAGCVTDGYTRDIRAIRALKFPVFHGGIAPLESKGRATVVEIDTPVECGGVRVESGDLVLGDADGVVVVPRAVQSETLSIALGKVGGEDQTREELANGVLLAEVFRRHGVL